MKERNEGGAQTPRPSRGPNGRGALLSRGSALGYTRRRSARRRRPPRTRAGRSSIFRTDARLHDRSAPNFAPAVAPLASSRPIRRGIVPRPPRDGSRRSMWAWLGSLLPASFRAGLPWRYVRRVHIDRVVPSPGPSAVPLAPEGERPGESLALYLVGLCVSDFSQLTGTAGGWWMQDNLAPPGTGRLPWDCPPVRRRSHTLQGLTTDPPSLYHRTRAAGASLQPGERLP